MTDLALFFVYATPMLLLLIVQTARAAFAVHRLAKRHREHDTRFLLTFGNDRATMQRVYGGLLK